MLRFFGYLLALVTGWFSWQFLFAKAVEFERASESEVFLIPFVLTFFALPIGMIISCALVWLWFRLISRKDSKAYKGIVNATIVSIFASLSSCGWSAASTQSDPPEILFFPIYDAFED